MVDRTGLVSYWKLDLNIDEAPDSHGSNHLTISGAEQAVTGKINNAFEFDGVDDHVFITDNTTLDMQSPFSIGGWVKLNATPVDKIFMGKTSNYFFDTGLLGTASKVNFCVYDGSWHCVESSTTTASLVGSWVHLMGTYDGTDLKIYTNGVETGTSADGALTLNNSSNNFNLNGDDTDTYLINGKIDEVSIWTVALDSDEISELYNGGDGLPYPFTFEAATYYTKGDKELKSTWPIVSGIEADEKHAGRQVNLVAEEGSVVPRREKVGL